MSGCTFTWSADEDGDGVPDDAPGLSEVSYISGGLPAGLSAERDTTYTPFSETEFYPPAITGTPTETGSGTGWAGIECRGSRGTVQIEWTVRTGSGGGGKPKKKPTFGSQTIEDQVWEVAVCP